jgi:nucleotide-binding universal stress UspA family protein
MLKHVLIPLDGSPLAEAALEETRRIISVGTHITLLTVVQQPNIPSFYYDAVPSLTPVSAYEVNEAIAKAKEYLENIAQGLRAADFVVHVRAEAGTDPAHMINMTAQEMQVDAIIMCTHGRSGISRWIFGSTTHKVLSTTCVPIYVIPSRERERKFTEAASEINYG